MAKKVKKKFLLPLVKITTLCIFSLSVCIYDEVADSAPSNTIETSKKMDQLETSDIAPSGVAIARVQSAAQKIVQEEASQNKASLATPLPQAVPTSGGRIKKGRNAADSSLSDQSEMRQVRGPSAIQDDDSLSTGKTGKGKSSANKGESF